MSLTLPDLQSVQKLEAVQMFLLTIAETTVGLSLSLSTYRWKALSKCTEIFQEKFVVIKSTKMKNLHMCTLYKLYAVPMRICSTHEDMHYP